MFDRGEFFASDECDQLFGAEGRIAGQDDGVLDAGEAAQRRRDLKWFHAETAYLYLIVDAPQIFNVSVREFATEISGAVQAA